MSKQPVVFLSAGHGGSDPGACANGLKEKDINLQTMLACQAELVRHGVTVICSRIKDENDPWREEAREANASGAVLAASFHANAGGGDGYEGLHYPGDKNGERLVQLAEKYVKELGQNSRGAKARDDLGFLNTTRMTAVIFESFFLDSKDRYIGDTIAEQKAFGVAYAKAILEYLGITYEEPVANTKSELYRVQVGAFSVKANADKLVEELKTKGYKPFVIKA